MSKLEEIVSLCKRRGFIFPGSEVYGGFAGTWDFGPLGVILKKKIMDEWWNFFVEKRDDMYGVDAAILMNPLVWKASGHTATFADPLVECKECKSRFRADKLIEDYFFEKGETPESPVDGWTNEQMESFLRFSAAKLQGAALPGSPVRKADAPVPAVPQQWLPAK